jgi:hypothetical protein
MPLHSVEFINWLKSLITDLEGQEIAVAENKSYVAAEAFYNQRKTVEMILEVIETGCFDIEK